MSFSSQTYWESRFTHETAPFEWLSSPDFLMPTLTQLLSRSKTQDPQILHIGCGSSSLPLELRRLLGPGHECRILNLDYAPSAIQLSSTREREVFGDIKMRWEATDLLDWTSLERAAQGEVFDVVIEKSCTDAIACGADVRLLRRFTVDTHPSSDDFHVYPPVALAIHLAAMTAAGAYWIAMSYSESRFDFLREDNLVKGLWQIERTWKMVADPGGNDRGVFRPEVCHYGFILRRTQA